MDIALLSKMLKELILANDEVSLPGLGVFVSEFVPASFSDKGLTINPPYRRLSFIQRDSSDDLLAGMYADGNGIPVGTAKVILEKTAAELAGTLQLKKTVVLPSLGRLRSTSDGGLFFVPEEDLDIYPDGTGLESVSLRTHVETSEEISGAVSMLSREFAASQGDAVEIPEGKSGGFRWWIIPVTIVVAAFLALGAFFALCHLDPQFIDSILYTPEELRIINY